VRELRPDARGSAMEARGKFVALVPTGTGRKGRVCPHAKCLDDARHRAEVATDIVRALLKSGQPGLIADAIAAACDADDDKVNDVRRGFLIAASGALGKAGKPAAEVGETFEHFATRWVNGDLARRYPDHVKVKKSSNADEQRLKTHVFPHVRGLPLSAFRIEHAEVVMRRLPKHLSSASRRQVAQTMHRVLRMAVYPARLIASNPMPPGFLPKVGRGRAHTYLYPTEDARLMASARVPIGLRLLYGFMAREGMRASEACGLRWSDVDLDTGTVALDENKTDDPRAWALNPGVVAALAAWRKISPPPPVKKGPHPDRATLPVFVDDNGRPFGPANSNLAERLRDELRAAGVDRPQLFEDTPQRQPLRAHDLRATFVTLALAGGKSEAWVTDRTGHRSSQMLARYKRAARSAAELALGDLKPLVEAIPELAAVRPVDGSGTQAVNAPATSSAETLLFPVGPVGLEPTTNGLKEGEADKRALGRAGKQAPSSDPFPHVRSGVEGRLTAPGSPGDPMLAALDGVLAGLRAAYVANDAPALRRVLGALAALVAPAVDAGPAAPVVALRRPEGPSDAPAVSEEGKTRPMLGDARKGP
jgi:integrase